MLHQLSRKISVALISLVVFCTLLAVFLKLFDQSDFLGFTTLWLTFFVLSAPMFIVAGVAISFILDRVEMNSTRKFISFTLIGAMIILPYCAYILSFEWQSAWRFMIFGALAGLIYFSIQYLFEQFIFSQSTS